MTKLSGAGKVTVPERILTTSGGAPGAPGWLHLGASQGAGPPSQIKMFDDGPGGDGGDEVL